MGQRDIRDLDLADDVVRGMFLFADLDQAASDEVVSLMEWVDLRANEHLFHHGDHGGSLFVVVIGRLEVLHESRDGDTVLAHIQQGDTIGERTVFTGGPRTAGVRALTDAVLLKLSQESFMRITERYPAVLLRLVRILSERLTEAAAPSTAPPLPVARSFAFVGATRGAPTQTVFTRLAAVLSRRRDVLRLTRDDVEKQIGPQAIAAGIHAEENYRFSTWFKERLQAHDISLMLADDSAHWTRRCIDAAAHLLLVADVSAGLGALVDEARERRRGQRVTLVLVHRDGARVPSGTRRWLDALAVDEHFHVRASDEGDFDRVARFLAGESLCVGMGGGASRACASIGVVRALREIGAPIDLTCGTSLGAMIAALVALGWDAGRIHEHVRKYIVDGPMFDFTLPVRSLMAGRHYRTMLEETFEDMDVEDTWRPFFCVSTNLTRAELTMHSRGPLVPALRATAAIPGCYPPIKFDGDLLVDGALMNNLPVDRIPRTLRGRVVAVNVMARQDTKGHAAYRNDDNMVQAVWRRVRELRNQPPVIVDLMMQTAFLPAFAQAEAVRRASDVVLEPAVSHFGFFDTKAIPEIVEVGYADSRDPLAAWWATSNAGQTS
jgi:predicted acylesterase/phospholipase RssA/CRP-like cAMP-binding protein